MKFAIVYLLFCILFTTVHPKKIRKYIRTPNAIETMNRNDKELSVYSKKYKEAIAMKDSQIAYINSIVKDMNNKNIVKAYPNRNKQYLRRENM